MPEWRLGDHGAGNTAAPLAATGTRRRRTGPNPVSALGDRALHERDCPLALSAGRSLNLVPRQLIPAMERGEEWHWTCASRASPDRLIGTISLKNAENNNRGFWLGLPWQGQGLMTEACEAATDYWFDVLKFSGSARSQSRCERRVAPHLRKDRHAHRRHRRARIRFGCARSGNLGDHCRGVARPPETADAERVSCAFNRASRDALSLTRAMISRVRIFIAKHSLVVFLPRSSNILGTCRVP